MTNTHVRYDVTDGQAREPVKFTLPSSMTNGTGIARGEVSVTTSRDASFSLDVKAFRERPEGVDSVPDSDEVPLYLDITGDEEMNRSLEELSVDLSLSKSELDARGTSIDNVGVYRYHNGSWERLDATADEQEDEYVLKALSPGTSYYALGIREPVASVSNLSTASDVTVGEQSTVSADVINTGRANGTVTVTLRVDGEPVSNQSVNLTAGETRRVTFDTRYDTTGRHTVEIGTQRADVDVRDAGRVELADVTADASLVGPGESVTLVATFSNTGDIDETTTVTFGVAGGQTETRTVSVPAGQRKVVTFDQTLDEPGEYTLELNDRTFDVRVEAGASKFDTETADQTPAQSSQESPTPSYGMGVVFALAFLVIVVAYSVQWAVGKRE